MIFLDPEEAYECQGRYYTYRENNYIGSKGEIVSRVSFTPLKKISCEGCVHCGGIPDMMDAEIGEGLMIPYPNYLNHGEVVQLIAINDGRGFEDLYDEWHLEFFKIKKGANQ